MFKLELNTDGQAFTDNPLGELAACLDRVKEQAQVSMDGKIKDSNGNRVGSWSWL